MRRQHFVFATVAVALACAGGAATLTARQVPTFRMRTEVVAVDVLVRTGNKPVSGLTSADFELKDNGVGQQIDAVRTEAVPVDLSVILDVSGSTASFINDYKDGVRQIAKLLRPVDRIRLLAFAGTIQEVFPFTAPGSRLPLDGLKGEGGTALDDALLFAMAHVPEPPRRHLIVAFTDGGENQSVLDGKTLTEVAARADGVLHLVLSGSTPNIVVVFGGGGGGSLVRNLTMPPELPSVIAATEATGGEVHRTDNPSKLAEGFKTVFEIFRSGYVLQYSPRGVASPGWHTIAVTLKRAGKYDVTARKGYVGG